MPKVNLCLILPHFLFIYLSRAVAVKLYNFKKMAIFDLFAFVNLFGFVVLDLAQKLTLGRY